MISLTPELLVENIGATVAWYQKSLGFEVILISPEGESPIFARIKRGGVELMLFQRQAFSQEVPVFENLPTGGTFSLYITVDYIQKEWDHVQDLAQITQPLHTTNYGTQEFTITDNNGYHLTFAQRD